MKRNIITLFLLLASFIFGYSLHVTMTTSSIRKGRVTGLGGIFFKAKNPSELRTWYKTNLGLTTNNYGNVFEWRKANDSSQKGFTQWSPFNEKTNYFAPSTKDFMINYRVEHLDDLINHLKLNQVTILDTIATYNYGRFVHILDLEGNKIELWEPNDIEYEKMGLELGAETTK